TARRRRPSRSDHALTRATGRVIQIRLVGVEGPGGCAPSLPSLCARARVGRNRGRLRPLLWPGLSATRASRGLCHHTARAHLAPPAAPLGQSRWPSLRAPLPGLTYLLPSPSASPPAQLYELRPCRSAVPALTPRRSAGPGSRPGRATP